eukprot:776726-Amphidinium_carterae.1
MTPGRIHQQVLRLDVTVNDAVDMEVCECPRCLVGVQLDQHLWSLLLLLAVTLHDTIDSLWHIFHDHVE